MSQKYTHEEIMNFIQGDLRSTILGIASGSTTKKQAVAAVEKLEQMNKEKR